MATNDDHEAFPLNERLNDKTPNVAVTPKKDDSWEKQNVRRLLDSSSISGLPKIVSADSVWTRVFWTVLLITGVIGLSINTYYLCARFASKPILNVHVFDYEDFIWPDVIVCNPVNPLAFWRYPDMSTEWDRIVNKSKPFMNLRYAWQNLSEFDHAIYMSSINPRSFGLKDHRNMIPFWFYTMKHGGMRPLSSFYDSKYPKYSGIHSIFQTVGFPMPCYTLSPTVDFKGAIKDLQSIHFSVLMINESYHKFNCHRLNRGLFVYIASPNHSISHYIPIRVPPGGLLDLRLSMSRIERLPEKIDCHDKHFEFELFDGGLESTHRLSGSYEDCKGVATQQLFLDECGCYHPFFHIFPSKRQNPPKLCFNVSMFTSSEIINNTKCLDATFYKYDSSDFYLKYINEKCGIHAKPHCNQTRYQITNEMLMLNDDINIHRKMLVVENAKGYSESMFNGSLRKALFNALKLQKENLAAVSITKNSPKGTLSTQELEYPFSQLISDIGGVVGLWIGLSIVGLFELIEISHAIFLYACRRSSTNS